MLALRLSDELAERLNSLAEATGRSKSKIVRDALLRYLEDTEDYLLAVARHEKHLRGSGKTYSLEEIASELGVDL